MAPHRNRPPSATELHRRWLELVQTDGPFLAVPALKRVWPQGMPALESEVRALLTEAKPAFEGAWERWDRRRDDPAILATYQRARDAWVRIVLAEVAGWEEGWITDLAGLPDGEPVAASPDRRVRVRPSGALTGATGEGHRAAALVLVVDPTDSLHDVIDDGWAASPIDRMEALLRVSGVEIGLVTDGRWWGLVCARPNAMVASGIVDAQTWVEEGDVRDAFLTLIRPAYLIGGRPENRLPALFAESVAAAEEITEALGVQVRRAVELLVTAFSETAEDARARGAADPLPEPRGQVYEAAVTVMMRVVFLLFAEERSLLPQGQLFSAGYGLSGELDAVDARARDDGVESLDGTHLSWHRLTVDEEIYRLAPAFVIATVDKFARLAREGEAASLFGYVRRRCERHGYVHDDYRACDLKDNSLHYARDGLPAAAVRTVARLRPPDLIIQDELHLITGALGTTVGLFEIAIDAMTTWTTSGGATVRPVIVASTATVRNAADQIRSLYGRDTTVFPPQVLDVADTFFSAELPITEANPGRRYVGLSTTGVRLTAAEIRVAEILLAAGQLLIDRAGTAADPYLTLVGYFSSVRELAGMTRYLGDDIQTALAKGRPWTGLPRRTGTDFGNLHVAELTARVSSGDITGTLDKMLVGFDPEFDATSGKERRTATRAASGRVASRETNPYDAILATAMLQVGVDVERLGLMLMVGQPKNTAEYIQASSRVGRTADRPGLVVTLGNWARPRDLAHYEQFRHYHETFYARVEALSVTPFSATSIERGLDAVLVSTARVLDATRANGLSPERAAGRVEQEYGLLTQIIDALVARAQRASDEDGAAAVRQRLINRLDTWRKHRQAVVVGKSKSLVYERVTDPSAQEPLLIGAENARYRTGVVEQPPFVVANSLREVQPEINLLVSPIEERLFLVEPPGSPQWAMPPVEDGTT